MATLKENLQTALNSFIENYTSENAVLALTKTFQSHNITVEDWNQMLVYLNRNTQFNEHVKEILPKMVEAIENCVVTTSNIQNINLEDYAPGTIILDTSSKIMYIVQNNAANVFLDLSIIEEAATRDELQEAISNAVSGLASESYVDSAVDGLASEAYVTEQLENYVTNSALESTLDNYATKNYVTSEIVSGLAPYATTDYVNIQIAAAVSNAYKWSGSKTVAELNALTVASSMHGNVYNVTSDGILNQGNVSVVAGDNVAVVWDAQNNTYSWDKLAGTFTVDLSGYLQKSTSFNSVYATTSNGSQIMIGYSESPTGSGGHLVLRKANGHILVPLTPSANGDATSKKYVDDGLAEKQDLLTFMNLTTDIDYVMEDE